MEHPLTARVPAPPMQPEPPNEMEHPPTASVPAPEIVYEPLPFGINDLMKATNTFLDTSHRAVLYRVDGAMARKEPMTLRLYVDNYREKFEAACLHGWHKRVTRVELARRRDASTELLGHGEGICKSWQDFTHLNQGIF